MKVTCKYCGIVDKPHHCPHSRKTNNSRVDKKIYKNPIWLQLRADVMENYNNICLWSLYVDGKIVHADEVHHIVEVLDNAELAYEYSNLIPLEFYNHKRVHKLYKRDKKKVQGILRCMLNDYANGDRTLGKYKNVLGIPPAF